MNDKAIVPFEELKTILNTEDVKEQYKQILGDRAPQFIASVINTVYLDDNLKECEPNSVLAGSLKAAVLDLPIDPAIGYAWLVPYKEKGVKKAQFQIGYRGYIQLAIRTGLYEIINVIKIYEGETVDEDRLTGEVKLGGARRSDEVIGYAAYFRLKTGFEKFLFWTKEEVTEHAKKYSKTWGKEWSPWTKEFDKMAMKTLIRQIISKYGVMTATFQNVIVEDLKVDTYEEDVDTIDARFTNLEEDAPPPPPPQEEPIQENGDRPYPPHIIKEKVAQISGTQFKDYEASDAQRNLLRYGLELCFVGTDDKDTLADLRHTVLNYLAESPSTRDVSGAVVKTLLDKWLGITKDDETGDYFINQKAAQEAQAIYSLALAREGQQSLL